MKHSKTPIKTPIYLLGLSGEGFRLGKSGDLVNRIVLSKAYIGKRKGPGKPSITSERSVVGIEQFKGKHESGGVFCSCWQYVS